MDAVKKLEKYQEYGLRSLIKYNFFKNIFFIFEQKWINEKPKLFINELYHYIKT